MEIQGADDILDDLPDLVGRIPEPLQRRGDGTVGDLEVTAPSELLELDQGEVGLDPCGVAVHEKADGPGRSQRGGLGVAVPMLLAELDGTVPRLASGRHQLFGASLRVDSAHMMGHTVVVGLRCVAGSSAVVPHHRKHCIAIIGELWEGPEDARHLGRGRISVPGEDGGQGTGNCPALIGVISDADPHQQRTEVGVAEAERPVVVRTLGDLLGRELSHRHRNLEHDRPQPDGMPVAVDVEHPGRIVVELSEVQRRQVAGGVVEEHVLAAGV